MTFSVLDKRPAKVATALPSSPPPGPLPGEQATEGRLDEARAHFEHSLARVPPELSVFRAQFLFHLGIVEQRANRPGDAESRFREALRLDPQHPAALIRLGVILWARGQREEATRAWEQYRQPGQALEQYRVAVALLPDDVTAGGRAKRLAMAMAPRDPVTCAP